MRQSAYRQEPVVNVVKSLSKVKSEKIDFQRISEILGVGFSSPDNFAASLPFALDDTTVGIENELQTVVNGPLESVDLPITIKESNYYKNMLRNTASGNTSKQVVNALEEYLCNNTEQTWENSWVRFPRHRLSAYARRVFDEDLRADKTNPNGPRRQDSCRFSFRTGGQNYLRIPVSYLLKLSLADALGDADCDPLVRKIGERMMKHFLSDNTSPEVFSFYPVPFEDKYHTGVGAEAETAKRFLFCQLLVQYANEKFHLIEQQQEVQIYFSPQPPLRQKILNSIISDAFYRELFMSPCLSGWSQGETKHGYMVLCHQVLSRSQLNGIKKLKDANIINHNLVVLPNISNTSLANNGTHVSLGSLKISRLLSDPSSGFRARDEKYIGDLVIKIVEHFLPLFVGTYSAAPYRLAFQDFHPEKALGFLPHELDFTHLRMIWRRWKKKAQLRFFGQPITPFGPEWLDSLISICLRLRGDFIVDFRLIDYLVSLLSTDQSPALDGQLDNDLRLKKDLAAMGVFDTSMPLYCLYRLRRYAKVGYSGFEGRHYSLFDSLLEDLGEAIRMQSLITALAFKYILKSDVNHVHIPDDPSIESERRQIFFGAAIGIPTFFVKKNTTNQFMQKILKNARESRLSRRYPGYIRVHQSDYRKALIEIIKQDAADLIETLNLRSTIQDLNRRCTDPDNYSVHAKLTKAILEKAGVSSPMALNGHEFNTITEKYYREDLRIRQMEEGFHEFVKDANKIDSWQEWRRGQYNRSLLHVLKGCGAADYVRARKKEVIEGGATVEALEKLIKLMLLTIQQKLDDAEKSSS